MKTKLLIIGLVGLALVLSKTCKTFGWCREPYVYFTFWPKCYDEPNDTYYVPYGQEITIDADIGVYYAYDPDCSGCDECDEGSLCSGDDLIRGLQKYKWYFGDGTLGQETCSSQDDGDFDAETTHTYTSTGPMTLYMQVYDVDETCDNGCPPGWNDKYAGLSKSIEVVRANLVMCGLSEDDEEDPGVYVGLNDDDDNDNGTPDKDESGTVSGEDDLVAISLSVLRSSLSTGKVRLNRYSSKIKVWDSNTKGNLILPDGGNDYKQWHVSSYPATLYVEGVSASSTLRDAKLSLSYRSPGTICSVHSDDVKMTVVDLDIKNPENPNKGESNDSDDYFFRGPEEPNVKVYYDFLPSGLTATSVKLLIKDGSTTLREISLPNSPGSNLLGQWDGKDQNGYYYDKWNFQAVIEVVIDGQTRTSDKHPIADLLYKHRPLVYTHANELSGPQDVNCMMKHADLKTTVGFPDPIVKTGPLVFGNLTGPNDTDDHYQNLDNAYRQVNQEPNEVYCRGTIDSKIFLQYWHFEPSSSVPESNDVFHEGDWEMFQIAVEPNTTAEELQPIAITASQHYYGQTIRWDSNGFDNGPSSVDQDYVGKGGTGDHQPKVYIARNAHATYFRQGEIGVSTWPPCTTANHGAQYDPTAGTMDEAGTNPYDYTLRIFHNSMISHWQGLWGEVQWGVPPPYAFSDDGPPSPRYRETAVEVWSHPREFNNYYRKRKSYPDGDWAHDETYIPE